MGHWGGQGFTQVMPPRNPARLENVTRLMSGEQALHESMRAAGAAHTPTPLAGRANGANGEPSYEELMAMHLRDNPPQHVPPVNVGRVPAVAKSALASVARADVLPDADCSICLECLGGASGARGGGLSKLCKLPCLHIYHRRCINEWLKHDLRCPLCRFQLPLERASQVLDCS